jgi:hypothetical protein
MTRPIVADKLETKHGMQFTSWQELQKNCGYWYRWFEGRGIPAAILRQNNTFAVFRKGDVGRKGEDGSYYTVKAPWSKVFPPPEIIASCNGYVEVGA